MQNEKNESSTLSTINAFVLFAYSAWVLFYSIFFNTSQSILRCLMECNTFWRSLFDQWTMNNRAGRATTIKHKQVANEPDQSNVQPSSSSTKKRQTNSWQMDTPPNKKSTTLVLPDTKLPNVRNVFVVFRAFRYNDELMGFGIWNSYVWRETIDHLYGFPANAYIRIADVLLPSTHPFVEEHEGTAYSLTNNASEVGKQSLAHLLLFSNAERSAFRISTQLQGFHFVTKRGLDQVAAEKWIHGPGAYAELTEDQLSAEMNLSNQHCQHFLQGVCAASQNPATPGTFMNNPATYTFIRQRRNIPEGCLDLFDRLLNTARGNVSRFTGEEIITPVEVATEEV